MFFFADDFNIIGDAKNLRNNSVANLYNRNLCESNERDIFHFGKPK